MSFDSSLWLCLKLFHPPCTSRARNSGTFLRLIHMLSKTNSTSNLSSWITPQTCCFWSMCFLKCFFTFIRTWAQLQLNHIISERKVWTESTASRLVNVLLCLNTLNTKCFPGQKTVKTVNPDEMWTRVRTKGCRCAFNVLPVYHAVLSQPWLQ